jgi:hypothetical protein
MKHFLLITVIAGVGAATLPLHSQAPVAAPAAPIAVAAGSALQKLKAIRDRNAKLLEQQEATLKKLDDLEKAAQQLKIFGSRA